jgi:hypothetical protein
MPDDHELVSLLIRSIEVQGQLLGESATHLADAATVLEHLATRHGDNAAAAVAIVVRDFLSRSTPASALVKAVRCEMLPLDSRVH